ncbi:FAD:protein FMN transferase [Rhodococcus aerolatus]
MSTPEPVARRWSVWSTTAEVVVTDPTVAAEAEALVRDELAATDAACSRFRPDSELAAVQSAGGRPVAVTAVLADLVAVAVQAAVDTDGAVDPTLGGAMAALGYDRDLTLLEAPRSTDPGARTAPPRVVVRRRPSWSRIVLDGRTLTLPAGAELDLGATAKARTADRAAARVRAELGCGVLVNLGGDLATAGPAPAAGWQVEVGDPGDEPRTQVCLPGGHALATSSTLRRRWRHDGTTHHHVLDPATGLPSAPAWRTMSVAAATCLRANTLATAALVHGAGARADLDRAGTPARLVAADRRVHLLGGWPTEVAAVAA